MISNKCDELRELRTKRRDEMLKRKKTIPLLFRSRSIRMNLKKQLTPHI